VNRLIAIASGKGGVGKTFLSICLAQALAERGRRVLLADGDLGLANVDVQLGLDPALDLGAVLAGKAGLTQAARPHPAGFAVLPGRSGAGGLASLGGAGLSRFLQLLRAAPWQDVVLDIGAGIGPAQRHLAASADLLLVLVNDEPTSLTDAYAVLKLHARDAPGQRAAVVVNNVPDAAAGRRAHAALDRACRSFLGQGVACLGVVRRDPRVPAAIRAQTPLLTRHPDSLAAQDVQALVEALSLEPALSVAPD
jgi:flagellar biosynthesis protein FlhG